ncbi:MAG: PDZ domain-containing protein [Acidobacteria bacterium]|nr:PDZ domain-containing protein [Acidobacteriota bacterium]
MNGKALLSLAALFILALPLAALAQQPPPPAATAAAAPPVPASPPALFAAAFYNGDNYLGVRVEELTRENLSRYGLAAGSEPRGVGVESVLKGSPAERAGLRERDVIIRFDGEEVTSVRKLNRLIDESSPEHTARLTVLRGGSEQQLSAKLGKQEGFVPALGNGFERDFGADAARRLAEQYRGDSEETRRRAEELRRRAEELGRGGEELRRRAEELQRNNPGGTFGFFAVAGRRIGITTSALGPQLAEYFGVRKGVLVTSVEENSPAAKSGLKAGDVIVEAEGEQVGESGDLSRALNRKEEGEVMLSVMRERKQRTIRVTPERRQPQSFQFGPGQIYTVPPVATIAPRAPRAPRALRTTPPAVRAFRGGAGRVL